jgi:diacylglycerol kinase family enzyme
MGRGQPEPADGLLDITAVVGVETTWETIQAIAALFHAGLTKSANGGGILHIQSKKVCISCTPEQKLVVDGEITGSTPEEFEINPGSLKIFVPASS